MMLSKYRCRLHRYRTINPGVSAVGKVRRYLVDGHASTHRRQVHGASGGSTTLRANCTLILTHD